MTTLLQLNSSINAGNGESSHLANEFVAGWKARNPAAIVVVRDLARDPVPHLTAERFQAFLAKPDARNAAQRDVVAYSDALIAEIRQADVIVLGLPMYNFGVPSMLKAYFDHIARAGVTFQYTANGPVGLLTGKKVHVFATRGGLYAGSPLDVRRDIRGEPDFVGFYRWHLPDPIVFREVLRVTIQQIGFASFREEEGERFQAYAAAHPAAGAGWAMNARPRMLAQGIAERVDDYSAAAFVYCRDPQAVARFDFALATADLARRDYEHAHPMERFFA